MYIRSIAIINEIIKDYFSSIGIKSLAGSRIRAKTVLSFWYADEKNAFYTATRVKVFQREPI
jgi:hypothetical protein